MSQGHASPTVSVAVVCICSAAHLARCLEALRRQESAPPLEIVVRHDPRLDGVDGIGRMFPEARVGCNEQEHTPLTLAAAAVRACTGDVILLTEDHCMPGPRWVRAMLDALGTGRSAVGGRVEIEPGSRSVDWAFYFTDFFRYAAPVDEGSSRALTVCNVAYWRDRLMSISPIWFDSFEEPAVHDVLRHRFGPLWMVPESYVTVRRSVSLPAALAERFAFGRTFAYTRVRRLPAATRWLYAAAAPALPAILLGRIFGKALRSWKLAGNVVRSILPLSALVVWWSFGEWMGYVTARPPRRLILAAERLAANSRDRPAH